MQHKVQFLHSSAATRQNGIKESSSGGQLELHMRGSPINVFGCPYVNFFV